MKIADMLENGYGCTKDLVAARQILLDLYTEIKDTTNLADPYPEVGHVILFVTAFVLTHSGAISWWHGS